MKVLYLTKYSRNGASSRLRSYQYFPFLEARGISVSVSPFFDEEYLINLYAGKKIAKRKLIKFYLTRFVKLFTLYKFDRIIIEKELFPYFFSWFEKALYLLKVKYIVDYDDAIFHNYDLSTNKLIAFFLKNKINNVMKYSGCVLAGNSYLAARAQYSGAKKVVLLPTVINTDVYTAKKTILVLKLLLVGLDLHQHLNISKIVVLLFSKLLEINNVELHIIGATEDLGLGDKVKYLNWSEDSEVDLISQFDIGIMPLENTPWELGKCAYKLIQYMGCGIPVVASEVGMNIEVVDEGVNGFLVKKEEEWLDRLNQLIVDSSVREAFGKKGRSKAELEFSIHKKQAVVLSVLDNE